MFNHITHSSVFVLDQDEALDFYVGKLGLEVTADVDMEVMRWLTVQVPGDPDHHVLLESVDNPFLAESREQIVELLGKGMLGLGFILTTDDCRATVASLADKGVEITQEPTERFYGVDAGIRDPFGNHIRITEPAPEPIEVPGASQSAAASA